MRGNKTARQLKLGVVGLGLGRLFVAAGLASSHVARVVICDSADEKRTEIRVGHPDIAAEYSDLEKMLKTEELDAVCVVTPDHFHRPQVITCLEHGSHVLVTKPIACNTVDARAIIAAADRAGRKLMVAQERRFRSSTTQMRAVLDAGHLGEIIYIRADSWQDKRKQFEIAPWHASSEAGRTAMVGTAVHEIDLIRYLAGGAIKAVSAFGDDRGTPDIFKGNKTVAATYQFENGIIGQVSVCYAIHKPVGIGSNNAQIIGTEGWISGRRAWWDGCEDVQEFSEGGDDIETGCREAVNAFLEALVNDTPVPVDGREAFRSVAAAAAADHSAASGELTVPEQF